VRWPEHDPLFPVAWRDRLSEFFSDIEVQPVPRAGHFVPREAPDAFASAVRDTRT
jgi:pimeloyl-ACP methyl ester carboxylesterase